MSWRAWVVGLGSGTALILVAHLVDLHSRQAALERFLADRSFGTVRIVEGYGLSPDQCGDQQGQEMYPLAAAFLTVESFATPRLSAWARGRLARVAEAMGLDIDISMGPGRIRPSTARKIMTGLAQDGAPAKVTGTSVVGPLLEPCGAIRVVIAMLEKVKGDHRAGVDLRFVRMATVAYNGQLTKGVSLEGDVAAKVYFDLVYNAFQHYRFMRHT